MAAEEEAEAKPPRPLEWVSLGSHLEIDSARVVPSRPPVISPVQKKKEKKRKKNKKEKNTLFISIFVVFFFSPFFSKASDDCVASAAVLWQAGQLCRLAGRSHGPALAASGRGFRALPQFLSLALFLCASLLGRSCWFSMLAPLTLPLFFVVVVVSFQDDASVRRPALDMAVQAIPASATVATQTNLQVQAENEPASPPLPLCLRFLLFMFSLLLMQLMRNAAVATRARDDAVVDEEELLSALNDRLFPSMAEALVSAQCVLCLH